MTWDISPRSLDTKDLDGTFESEHYFLWFGCHLSIFKCFLMASCRSLLKLHITVQFCNNLMSDCQQRNYFGKRRKEPWVRHVCDLECLLSTVKTVPVKLYYNIFWSFSDPQPTEQNLQITITHILQVQYVSICCNPYTYTNTVDHEVLSLYQSGLWMWTHPRILLWPRIHSLS